ncbi:MAG: pyridoxal phosphate-dependent decarboxylase family protein [Flavobacteriales bacterium]
MYWKKRSFEDVKTEIFEAIDINLNYKTNSILGLPGSYLDQESFYDDAPFLSNAPFISTMIANPNHIGCHTLDGDSEIFFKGTQGLERKLINLIAEEMLMANKASIDGYVAPGGTEANIQAMWCYRNYFRTEFKAKAEEICLIYSEDSHYSMPKGANLLDLETLVAPVDFETRAWNLEAFSEQLNKKKARGYKYFIVICNCATTMFGSVDDIDGIANVLESSAVVFKIHGDAAYGGYIYPFTNPESRFQFQNNNLSSITIDGHKMLQAPYGTGVFMIRKGFIEYCKTEEANYVQGKDYTLCGSRSGANAIAMWMIMNVHGSLGWQSNMETLILRANDICKRLDERAIEYFRNPHLNIIAIKSKYLTAELARKHFLVGDHQEHPKWYKIVVMPHVKRGLIDQFFLDLDA